jgi:hypothetical protein
MKKVWPILLALAVGCNDNPYPDAGQNVSTEAPKEKRTVRNAISVDFSDRVFNFSEGTEDFYRLNVKVPAGKPIIKVKGLPDGAVYETREVLVDEHPSDPSKNVYERRTGLWWLPDTKVVNTEVSPELRQRIFEADVFVSSSLSPSVKSSFKIFLKVKNTRGQTKLDMGQSWDNLDVNEGGRDDIDLTIDSKDFPNGEFDLSISPRIEGLRYEPVLNRPTKYKVVFEPNFDAIHVKDCGGSSFCKKTFDVSFRVTEPDNHTTNIVKKVSYQDRRQDVAVSLDEEIEIGLNGTFQFLSSDPNNEVEPRVELSGPEPEFGKFELVTSSFTATNKSTLTKIKWTDIPQSMIGENEFLSFRVCNYDYDDYNSNSDSFDDPSRCRTRTIEVKIEHNQRPAPELTRDNWLNNERKYFLVGEKKSNTISFKVPADEDAPQIDLIRPKAAGDGAGSDPVADNNIRIMQIGDEIRIDIEAVKPGPAQFSIRLTSAYGVQHTEGFFFEVLPADWSSTLVLGESKRSQEQKNLEANIDNYDFINPFNTALKFPVTLKRDTIVIGTDILKDMPADDFFDNIFENFENIIIASPLINELPESVLRRFKDAKVEPKNDRLKQQDPNVDFSKLELIANSDVISTNSKLANLKGDSTNESQNPSTLFVKRNSPCKITFFISDDAAQKEYPVTAVCNRAGAGKMVLMGTEWGEFKMDATEKELPKKWFDEHMKLEIQ